MEATETKENFNDLNQRIKMLGNIKEILRDPRKIQQILAYSGDRHLCCAFYDAINEGLEKGEITEGDLRILRSGQFMDWIVNLEQTVNEVNPRPLYNAELLDKINYVGNINDRQTLVASYTHPVVISALCGEMPDDKKAHELVWWSTSGTFNDLPAEAKSAVVLAVLQKGNQEVAEKLLISSMNGLQPFHVTDVDLEEERYKVL